MAGQDASNNVEIGINDPHYIHHSDQTGIKLVGSLFDGTGYGVWKQAMLIALSAKNKLGFINGTSSDSSAADLLQRCNDILLTMADDPEYEVIVGCNALSVDIEDQIMSTYNLIRDNYRLKYPELESIVHHPIDYARIVKKIGNESDISLVDLEGLLRPPIIMVVSITASTTSGKPLPDDVLQKTLEACDRALHLDSARKKLVDFLETRMFNIAPNLSELVGSGVAAKLMVSAGGLGSLAKMPACNVQLVGAQTKNLAGFSCQSHHHIGYLEQTEIFRSTPPALRKRVSRLLAAKSTLVARVDSTRGDPTGKMGRALRQDIHNKIDKWQQLPPPKIVKPLLVPNLVPKKKRGGPRLRKMKERYAVTDLRKLANRIQFGVPQDSNSYQ